MYLLYKLSYLNLNFALTLGNLNPALSNPALMTKTFSYNLAQKKMEQKNPLPLTHSSIKDEAIQRSGV